MFNKKRIIYFLILINIVNIISLVIVYREPKDDTKNHILKNLDISLYVNKDGSARVKENWEIYITDGYEISIPKRNLGGSRILDFTVSENGELYEYSQGWPMYPRGDQIKKRNSLKENRNIDDVLLSYELLWGIGEYGLKNYELEYTITNFVEEFQDKQGIYWTFVNKRTSNPPENISLKIEGDEDFLESNSNIWTLGYKNSKFKINDNGEIKFLSDRAFSKHDSLAILVELENNTYDTDYFVNQPFKDIQNTAFKDYSYKGILYYANFLIKIILSPPALIIFGIFIIIQVIRKAIKRIRTSYKGEYYRDYPYEGEFQDVYYLLNKIEISDRSDLMTGFILKWIHMGFLSIVNTEKGETGLQFNEKHIDWDWNSAEGILYDMMLRAAGTNEILESNEFTEWSRKNYKRIERWEDRVKEISLARMQELDYISYRKEKMFFSKEYGFFPTFKGKRLEKNTYKFRNYLRDFSLLGEYETINVGIWDNLMIWAGFLGITETVAKEFDKLYPGYVSETNYRDNNNIFRIRSFARSSYSSSMRAAAKDSSNMEEIYN